MQSEADRGDGALLSFGSPDFEARSAEVFRYSQVGRCANGVAHDLNNYLGAVMAYSELIGLEKNLSDEARRMLSEVVEGVRKASNLLGIFTGHARKNVKRISLVNPVRLLEHLVELQTYNCRSARVAVHFSGDREMPSVVGDAPKLEQAFNFLFLNALEAVEGSKGGAIYIAADMTATEVVVVFRDTAAPIPQDLRERMFLPYVTTKPGAHLGLGLAVARQIAAMHAGTVDYDPATGFTVRLPIENGLMMG